MPPKLHRVVIPQRLPSVSADTRVKAAMKILDDIVELTSVQGLTVVRTEDPQVSLEQIDGLILPGGGDIDPSFYGGFDHPMLYDVNPAQDALDFTLAHRALETGIPIFGICRGMQILNSVYGGSLYEDLPDTSVQHRHAVTESSGVNTSEDIVWTWHEVRIQSSAEYLKHVKSHTLTVASAHHQGVRELGEGLTIDAVAADGLIEAFSDRSSGVIAVQWHPEAADTQHQPQTALFAAFADQVRSRTKLPAGV